MPSALDVAQFILAQRGPMTAMKLQKLVYYSQVWTIVWDDDCLFPEPIEAWKNGPVVRALWEATRGQFRVDGVPGAKPDAVNGQGPIVEKVLSQYGDKDAQWLSDLTHMEDPWKNAYAKGQNTVIDLEDIAEYYSSLGPENEAV